MTFNTIYRFSWN